MSFRFLVWNSSHHTQSVVAKKKNMKWRCLLCKIIIIIFSSIVSGRCVFIASEARIETHFLGQETKVLNCQRWVVEIGRHLFHSRLMPVLLKTKNLLFELRPGWTEASQNGTAMEQQVSDHGGRSRKCVEAYLGRFNLQSQRLQQPVLLFIWAFFFNDFYNLDHDLVIHQVALWAKSGTSWFALIGNQRLEIQCFSCPLGMLRPSHHTEFLCDSSVIFVSEAAWQWGFTWSGCLGKYRREVGSILGAC